MTKQMYMSHDEIAQIVAKREAPDGLQLQSQFCRAKECFLRCNPNNCPPANAQRFNVLQLINIINTPKKYREILLRLSRLLKEHDNKTEVLEVIRYLIQVVHDNEAFLKELLAMKTPFVLMDYYGLEQEILTVSEKEKLENSNRRSDYDKHLKQLQGKRARIKERNTRIAQNREASAKQQFYIDAQRKAYISARASYRKPD